MLSTSLAGSIWETTAPGKIWSRPADLNVVVGGKSLAATAPEPTGAGAGVVELPGTKQATHHIYVYRA